MSRLIVKNLPKYVTKEKLTKVFDPYGSLTDVYMVHTKDGKFRSIAFIGYENEQDANNAIEKLHNTYYDTRKITVETALGENDESLSKPWSKHSSNSISQLKENQELKERQKIISDFRRANKTTTNIKPKKSKKELTDKLILEKFDINENDIDQLNEFLSLNNQDPIKKICSEENDLVSSVYTVRLTNLRNNINIMKILELFKELNVIDIRILSPKAKKNVCSAFVDFESEDDVLKALTLNGKAFRGTTLYVKRDDQKSAQENIESVENTNESSILENGRLYVRNLPFNVEKAELELIFAPFGEIVDISLPVDKKTSKPIGTSYITFMLPENAVQAFNSLNQTIFKGRRLAILPSEAPTEETQLTGIYKLDKLKQKKENASKESFSWNSLFINQNAVANITAARLNISKNELLKDSNNPAINLATAESKIVKETRNFLENNGINLDCFSSVGTKSDRIMLLKNLPENVPKKDLKIFIQEKLLGSDTKGIDINSKKGLLPSIIIPPYGVTAILEFGSNFAASNAFKKLAFSRFRFLPLYLEWAPVNVMTKEVEVATPILDKVEFAGFSLFMKNLNVETTEQEIEQLLKKYNVAKVTIAKKQNPNTKKVESLGYGFLNFEKKLDASEVLKKMQGHEIGGNKIELKWSEKNNYVEKNTNINEKMKNNEEGEEIAKLLVKNIAFEATTKDLMELFSVYGKIKSIRLPLKQGNYDSNNSKQHRGFGFIEFRSVEEAKNCIDNLGYSTHIYGRRLVLEWANDSNSINTLRKRTIDHFETGKNNSKVQIEEEP